MDCAVVTAYEDIRPAMGRRGVREGDAGRSDIPERALWKLWKRRAALQEEFRTGSGRRVRVLYPGRTGTAAGPDFRDALLEVEGVGVVRGDVEIHLRGKDWAAHGHSDDPNYNGVVVHGALRVDEQATRLHSGATVPVIGLDGLLTGKDDDAPAPAFDLWPLLARKGFPRPTSKQEAGELLDRAGDQRFRAKASELGRFTQEQGAEQTLYEALMEGLGYRHNRQPFLKLAQRAPYATVQRAALRLPPEERAPAILGWLLAISDLGDPAARSRPAGLRQTMSKEEWHLFRVRPSNRPENRIKGAARLLTRYLDAGLVEGLQAAAGTGQPGHLTNALAVEGSGGPAYIGAGRARELAVNAVLPFLHATGTDVIGSAQDSEYLELFRRYPKLPDNEVAREMANQLFPAEWRGLAGNARRQQGLLHLAALLRGASFTNMDGQDERDGQGRNNHVHPC